MIEARGGTVAEVWAAPGRRPSHEIVKNTRDEDVGLVVGDRGLGRFRYATRMSIPANVVRDAWCPVLVVRGDVPALGPVGFDKVRFPRKVLLATDGSPDAALAAEKAVEICRSGSEFHVAHVWGTRPSEPGTHDERGGQEILDAEARRIEGIGGAVAAAHLLRGHPAEEIQRLGEEVGAELVVVGGRVSEPEGAHRAAASTSRSVASDSSLPVLVVRGDRPARPLVEVPARVETRRSHGPR